MTQSNAHNPRTDGPPRRRGLTIVEVAVSAVIVAVLLVASLQTLGAAARARVVQAGQTQAPALARLLMSEIRQTRYADDAVLDGPLGPEAGEYDGKTRTAYDDVDDFDGLSESSPRAADGSPLSGAGNWRRDTKVEWVRPDRPDVVATSDTGLKRITVSVSGPGGTFTLVALRSRYGGYDQLPAARTTYVAGVGVDLKTGATRLYSGANLANQVEAP
jgi:MSHA pilin protein MshD